MRRRPLLQATAVVVGSIASCAAPPSSATRLSESIVVTERAPSANFSAYRTFFIRPEIRVLLDDGTAEPIVDEYATPLLDETTRNLTARGFQQVNVKADAELAVELDYLGSVNTAITCYSWWDAYYWGYPDWDYYPYYGDCTNTTWHAGTLATMVVDLTPARNAAPHGGEGGAASGEGGAAGAGPTQKLLGAIWFSGVYGLDYTDTDATIEGIDQAFVQSPYLASSP